MYYEFQVVNKMQLTPQGLHKYWLTIYRGTTMYIIGKMSNMKNYGTCCSCCFYSAFGIFMLYEFGRFNAILKYASGMLKEENLNYVVIR